MRRRLLLGAGVVVLLVAGFAVFLWLTTPSPGITLDNFYRLRKGMSSSEVEALLGQRYEGDKSLGVEALLGQRYKVGKSLDGRVWRSHEVEIALDFDADRLVSGVAALREEGIIFACLRGDIQHIRTDESSLDRIRRWLRL